VVATRAVVLYTKEPSGTVAEAPAPSVQPQELAELRNRMELLSEAVAEGITKVSRNENRIQKTVTSAHRRIREAGLEHAGIEAEFDELIEADAEEDQPLPLVPQGVAEVRTLRVPGGTIEWSA